MNEQKSSKFYKNTIITNHNICVYKLGNANKSHLCFFFFFKTEVATVCLTEDNLLSLLATKPCVTLYHETIKMNLGWGRSTSWVHVRPAYALHDPLFQLFCCSQTELFGLPDWQKKWMISGNRLKWILTPRACRKISLSLPDWNQTKADCIFQ